MTHALLIARRRASREREFRRSREGENNRRRDVHIQGRKEEEEE